MTTERSPIERYPVVAILGKAAGSEWQISGSGILVSSKHVLTVNHVVRTPMHASRRRIFSPLEGIRTIEDDVDIETFDIESMRNLWDGLALVELESGVKGVRPAQIRKESLEPGLTLTCAGFGGSNGGLMELDEIDVEVRETRDSPAFLIPREADLGPGESGCPLLIDGEVAGIYFGLDDEGDPLGLSLVPLRKRLEHRLGSDSSMDAEWTVADEKIEVGSVSAHESSADVKTHEFRTHLRGRMLVVTVAAASVPDGYLPEIKLEVGYTNADWKPKVRHYESWYETARIGWPKKGLWRAKVTSYGGAAQYQLRWTLFVD